MHLTPILNAEYRPVIQGAGVIIQSLPSPYAFDPMIWNVLEMGQEIAAHFEQERV